jgi:hypothetical protein
MLDVLRITGFKFEFVAGGDNTILYAPCLGHPWPCLALPHTRARARTRTRSSKLSVVPDNGNDNVRFP